MFSDLFSHFSDFIAELFKKEEVWFLLVIILVGGAIAIHVPAAVVSIGSIWYFLWRFLELTWWFWLFIILFQVFKSTWLFWRRELFKRSIKWTLLELRIPLEIQKSPQAMEQVLKGLHSLGNYPGDIREKYWDGEVTLWFSLEMVSFGGEIRFFVRCDKKQKDLVEAQFFSYYPDVEVVEVDDYINAFPQNLAEMREKGLELWGTEMVLAKEDAYPIKTYPNFESTEEEKQFDPISTFLEVLGKVKKEEVVGIQILIAPAPSNWKDKWEKLVEELQEPATMAVSAGESEGDTSAREVPIARTPGQTDVLEAVEENLSKPAFSTLIRFIYLSPREMFYDSFARKGLRGAFQQYGALNLNSFKDNKNISTRTRFWDWPHIFSKRRNEYRKERILYNYRRREVPPETRMGRLITSKFFNWNFHSKRFHMNVEGLATLFHPPTAVVLTAPHIRRVESRKAGPPAGLAIFGGEEEIEKYK